jgi:hypothetical protein
MGRRELDPVAGPMSAPATPNAMRVAEPVVAWLARHAAPDPTIA